jgi:hypothetical protein
MVIQIAKMHVDNHKMSASMTLLLRFLKLMLNNFSHFTSKIMQNVVYCEYAYAAFTRTFNSN